MDSSGNYGSSALRVGRHLYRASDNSRYYESSANDMEWCEGDLSEKFICISDSLYSQETILQKQIEDLEKQINTFIVNQYSQQSVNTYNSLIVNFNSEVSKFNNFLKNNCEPAYEYCKPYNCNKKFPGTIYKKETDMCVCDNSLPYDEIKKECPIKNKIPVVEKKDNSISSSGNTTEAIVYILLGIGILRFLIDKYNAKNTLTANNNQMLNQNNQNSQSKPKSYFDEIMENK